MDTIEDTVTDVVGPSYNYANHILDPIKLKISGKDDMDALWQDMGGMAAYVDTLTFGNKVSEIMKSGVSLQARLYPS